MPIFLVIVIVIVNYPTLVQITQLRFHICITSVWLLHGATPDCTGPVPDEKWVIILLRRRIKRRKTR